MSTTTRMTFEDFQKLPEREGAIYELDEGTLLTEQGLTPRHNLIRQRIAVKLIPFVESNRLGVVAEEMDFRLAPDTVRNPDVASSRPNTCGRSISTVHRWRAHQPLP